MKTPDNLVERLYNKDGRWTAHYCKPHQIHELREEAAREIERLQELVLVKSKEILAMLEIIKRYMDIEWTPPKK